ncbi:hypothetical protein AB0K71_06065 [Streptomyces syringium]|uniref:hypothetical protein n=1 Tax=Streptomyces syringium TaxID=76729 RepID=UPI0034292035
MTAALPLLGGVGVVAVLLLMLAVSTQLSAVTAYLHRRVLAPEPPYAGFDLAETYRVVLLDCAGCPRFHSPHEVAQDGTARCVECGTKRTEAAS